MHRKIYYWDKAISIDDGKLLNEHKKEIAELLAGECKSANLDLKKLPGSRIYSIRLNASDRLLVTTVKKNGISYLVLLEKIVNHDYTKSRFLKRDVLKHFLDKNEEYLFPAVTEESFEGAKTLDIEKGKASIPDVESDLELAPLEYYNDKFIVLNDKQNEAVKASLPLLVSGPAGSGKTCVALSLLEQCAKRYAGSGKPVVFITESKLLKSTLEAQWRASPASSANDNVIFMTYDEMLESLLDKKKDEYVHIGNKDTYKAWFKDYLKKAKQIAKTDSANEALFSDESQAEMLYQEFRTISACKKRDDYFALGKKQCVFQDEETKSAVWLAYQDFLAELKVNKILYPAFHLLNIQNVYSCALVDEAQDLSCLQLDIIAGLAENRQACFCMDSHQSLHDNKSKRPYLLDTLRKITNTTTLQQIELPYTYRCSEKVAKAGTALVYIKIALTGGKADKLENPVISVAPENTNTGSVHYIDHYEFTAEEEGRFDKFKDSTEFAVVTLPEYVEEAKKRFKTSLVFTPNQIKGLEYETVVAFRLFDSDAYKQANKIYGKSEKVDDKKTVNRPKNDHGDESFGPLLNETITAFTRAKKTLFIVQEKSHKSDHILKELLEGDIVTPWKGEGEVAPSTRAQWEAEAKKQAEHNNKTQAEAILKSLHIEAPQEVTPSEPVLPAPTLKPTSSPAPVLFRKKKKPYTNPSIAAPDHVVKQPILKEIKFQTTDWLNVLSGTGNDKDRNMFVSLKNNDNSFLENLYNYVSNSFNKNKTASRSDIEKIFANPDKYMEIFIELLSSSKVSVSLLKVLNQNKSLAKLFSANVLCEMHGDSCLLYKLLQSDDGVRILDKLTSQAGFAEQLIQVVRSLPETHCINKVLKSDKREFSPLYFAVNEENVKLAQLLLQMGYNPNQQLTLHNFVPLHIAVQNQNLELTNLLISAKCDLNMRDSAGTTALCMAAWNNHANLVTTLLHAGADPNMANNIKQIPMMFAAQKGYANIVRILMDNHADPHLKDVKDRTALAYAVLTYAKVDILPVFQNAGCDFNLTFYHRDDEPKTTLLYEAAERGDQQMAKALLAAGCNPNQAIEDTNSPLFGAAGRGDTEMVRILIDAGANPQNQNNVGQTPLMFAAQEGHIECVKVLLERDSDYLKQESKNGYSPLFYAVGEGREAIVKLLIEKGFDPSGANIHGQTPIMLAKRGGSSHIGVIRLLAQAIAKKATPVPAPAPKAVVKAEETVRETVFENHGKNTKPGFFQSRLPEKENSKNNRNMQPTGPGRD